MPTLDRIFLGLFAGAAFAALVGTAVYVVLGQGDIGGSWFATLVLCSLYAAGVMFVLQPPVWTLFHSLRMRGWPGCVAATSFAFTAAGTLLSWAVMRRFPAEFVFSVENSAMVVIGAVAGWICWRVSVAH